MAKLSEKLKNEIVVRLAQYEGYSEIARAISAEYDVAVTRFQVRSYDPSKSAFAGSEKWRVIFDKERQKYCSDISAIPISHQAFRLNELNRNYFKARDSSNLVLANSILEQAAKEVGGVLTNNRNVAVNESPENVFLAMSPDERRQAAAELIHNALDRDVDEKSMH